MNKFNYNQFAANINEVIRKAKLYDNMVGKTITIFSTNVNELSKQLELIEPFKTINIVDSLTAQDIVKDVLNVLYKHIPKNVNIDKAIKIVKERYSIND